MAKRKDKAGRVLRTGEFYDVKNERYLFRKMVDGIRYNCSASSLQELRKKVDSLMDRIESGCMNEENVQDISLDSYFDIWIEAGAKFGRKATTITNYKAYYYAHVRNKELGTKRLRDITKKDCESLFGKMLASGAKKSTLNNMKACLSLIFASAEDDKIIQKNPCKNIRFSGGQVDKREAVEEAQLKLFMDFVRLDEEFSFYYPLFVVLANTAARVGEVIGLTKLCVDIPGETIVFKYSLNRYRKKDRGYTMALGSVKSATSNREIAMNDLIKEAFRAQENNMLCAKVVEDTIPIVDDYGRISRYEDINNLVFRQINGSPWTEPRIVSLIHRIVKKQNTLAEKNEELLKYFSPHQLRHTYVTIGMEKGISSLAMSHRLGHASPQVTTSTYAHLRDSKKLEQEELFNKIRIE